MVRLKNPNGMMYVFKDVYIQFLIGPLAQPYVQQCWVATLKTIIAINAEDPQYDQYLYKNDCIIEKCGGNWIKLTCISKNLTYKLQFGSETAEANFLLYTSMTNEPEIVVPPVPHSSPTSCIMVSTASSSETPSPASLSRTPTPPSKTPSPVSSSE